jgi:hypothetical protein
VVADTCRVYPVTAKHETKAELGHPWGAKIYSHALRKTKHVSFPEMGLTRLQQPIILKGSDEDDDNVKLPFGLDFTFGSVLKTRSIPSLDLVHPFRSSVVTFESKKGQHIGIAVWRVAKIFTEGTIGRLSLGEEVEYFGPPEYLSFKQDSSLDYMAMVPCSATVSIRTKAAPGPSSFYWTKNSHQSPFQRQILVRPLVFTRQATSPITWE